MKSQQTAISAHTSTFTDQLAFHSHGQTILVTLVTKKCPVACITVQRLKFGTWRAWQCRGSKCCYT